MNPKYYRTVRVQRKAKKTLSLSKTNLYSPLKVTSNNALSQVILLRVRDTFTVRLTRTISFHYSPLSRCVESKQWRSVSSRLNDFYGRLSFHSCGGGRWKNHLGVPLKMQLERSRELISRAIERISTFTVSIRCQHALNASKTRKQIGHVLSTGVIGSHLPCANFDCKNLIHQRLPFNTGWIQMGSFTQGQQLCVISTFPKE